MHLVFQRDSLILDSALNELLGQPDTELGYRLRAAARNVMHDHRVGLKREGAFQQCMVSEPKLINTLREYYRKHVRSLNPHFLDPEFNQDNFVAGVRIKVDEKDPNTPLIRVLNLSREREAFQWGAREWGDRRNNLFLDIANARNDGGLHAAIGRQLSADTETFLRAWFDMCEARRKALRVSGTGKTEGPVWVTFAKCFLRDVDPGKDGPDRWFEVVGVHPDTAPVWAVILCYPLRAAGTLARPTILDAGGYSYHFPSPPLAELGEGGFMMDLRPDPAPEQLRNEFIHQTIDFKFDHWTAAGSRYGETTRAGLDGIDQQREVHHALLERSYNGVRSWMPQCV